MGILEYDVIVMCKLTERNFGKCRSTSLVEVVYYDRFYFLIKQWQLPYLFPKENINRILYYAYVVRLGEGKGPKEEAT